MKKLLFLSLLALNIQINAQNVGIGTPNPTEKLDVTGNINVTGTIKANGVAGTAGQVLTNNGGNSMSWASVSYPMPNAGNYGIVTNPVTGKIWLDRNLGATQVASSATDVASYGDLYQWGRNADGHQLRTSSVTTTLASSIFTNNGFFIRNGLTTPFTWTNGLITDTNMWSGTAAENNPCPSGFRVPTAAEWEQERRTWATNNAIGAFNSPLKLSLGGKRSSNIGTINGVGTEGNYWSSSPISSNAGQLSINSIIAEVITEYRANGFCVRCIKD
jgi:uncharacterized protein (TIGR02145 family)